MSVSSLESDACFARLRRKLRGNGKGIGRELMYNGVDVI